MHFIAALSLLGLLQIAPRYPHANVSAPLKPFEIEIALTKHKPIVKGSWLWVDYELMKVIHDSSTKTLVNRGQKGTVVASHAHGSVAIILPRDYDFRFSPPSDFEKGR